MGESNEWVIKIRCSFVRISGGFKRENGGHGPSKFKKNLNVLEVCDKHVLTIFFTCLKIQLKIDTKMK